MWKYPTLATPSIIQVEFGPWGENLPGDGLQYCGPTSTLMGLYWLSANGFTQLAPATYNGQEDPAATNLELVIGGLCHTSSIGGTGSGMMSGMSDYFSACGVAPGQVTYAQSDNPSLDWIVTQLAPNWEDTSTIVLANFSVRWYSRPDRTSTIFVGSGGHFVVPLVSIIQPGLLEVNNPAPTTFLSGQRWTLTNPQIVKIAPVPEGWTLPGMSLPSQSYSQVITDKLGEDHVAIIGGAAAWTLTAATTLPSSSSYKLSPWNLTASKAINTNGGTLTVIAPLEGAGGLYKGGQGMLQLDATNSLSGENRVTCGILASNQTSGTPFGTGTTTFSGGGVLQLPASASVTVASGHKQTIVVDDGGGMLQLQGAAESTVTLGGYTDGRTPNIARATAGTLVIAPGVGIDRLGEHQYVIVAGKDKNLPLVSNNIVSPYLLGQDNDPARSGKFLTYGSSGFAPAPITNSNMAGINHAGGKVYRVLDHQTIAGSSVQLAALEMSGGRIEGVNATLLVGDQTAGSVAGVIMNGGSIGAGTLSFGSAEGLIYASATTGVVDINSAIASTGGLTMFGPGMLALFGDSSSTLSGTVTVNSGTLVASSSSGSATGSAAIVVNSGGTLNVHQTVSGSVTVGQSGTLCMNGGTVTGGVTIAAIGQTSDLPGGILQGGGTISGPASIGGVIECGPSPGIVTFAGQVEIQSESSFFWQLQALVDNSDKDSGPGIGWNALAFQSPDSGIGTPSKGVRFFLDFSVLGSDPDGGAAFWQDHHTWTIATFEQLGFFCNPLHGNFTYRSGLFCICVTDLQLNLYWTPGATGNISCPPSWAT